MAILNTTNIINFKNNIPFITRNRYMGRKDRLFEARQQGAVTVFLSHSHSDASSNKDIFEGAISLLSSQGVEVYVDWLDESMPKVTNASTALKLKEKINSNKKFVLVASPNAITSNWVNWELGLGDAAKYQNHIALFPFVSDSSSWKDAEYLNIYPYIEKANPYLPDTIRDNYVVRFPNGQLQKLSSWLAN
ncbi:toll/interleukin-1 receptor domain-containing protein [Pontibacter sp. Tf4]|uniref:toll/interleukin-1 receptor domain-containing protein n=1 Tax=Pontibacter sp. Tf4 TaxID=2761620 RepID=UPI001623C580|nr:toll/interleukin-1 receptor domain-containing protein [Pontibacter sp. Tf4]MBB6610486.1 toll/interleukin-1 receptor domain-containing protein [Pontibacter sp. Tf4]